MVAQTIQTQLVSFSNQQVCQQTGNYPLVQYKPFRDCHGHFRKDSQILEAGQHATLLF